jgi:signal transduction histidine kinase
MSLLNDSRFAQTTQWIAKTAGFAVAAAASVACCGWAFDAPAVKGVVPGLPEVPVYYALCMLLTGLALGFLSGKQSQTIHSLGFWLATAACLFAALPLVVYVLPAGWSFARPSLAGLTESNYWRVSPGTSLLATTIALAVVLVGARWNSWLCELPAVVPAMLCLVAIFFYVAHRLEQASAEGAQSLVPALSFVALSVGALLARPDRGLMSIIASSRLGGITSRWLLPCAVLAPPILLFLWVLASRVGMIAESQAAVLLLVTYMVVFSAIVLYASVVLNRIDDKQRRTQEAIERLNAELEQRVRDRTADLESAQAKLIRTERLAVLGQLAARVAHEIRNPLNVISSSIYLLQNSRRQLDVKQLEHLEKIDRYVQTVGNIISQLTDYALIPQAQPQEFGLAQAVEEVLTATSVPAGVCVEWAAPAFPVNVTADRGHVERILSNLVTNAVQAMPGGGELMLRVGTRENFAVAEVADTGTGIEKERLPQVFEPLYSTKVKGLGLGLALSKSFAEWNSGTLEVDSQPGQLTTFRLLLPLANSSACQ